MTTKLLARVLFVIAVASVPAWGHLIEFDLGRGGTISYSGGTNPLMGVSIPVPTLVASGNHRTMARMCFRTVSYPSKRGPLPIITVVVTC